MREGRDVWELVPSAGRAKPPSMRNMHQLERNQKRAGIGNGQ